MLKLKDFRPTPAEKLWLQAIYDNGGIPDPQTFKVKFHDKLPKDFDYRNLHSAFIWDNRLNVLGIWLLNPKDKIFENLDKVIKAIRAEIRNKPKLESITAVKVSELTGISVENSKEALGCLGHFGGFWSSAHNSNPDAGFGHETIGFGGTDHIDAYLNYTDIRTLLEKTWDKFRIDLYIRPDEAKTKTETDKPCLCYTKLCHSVFYGDEIWSFHGNAAQVVQILIRAFLTGLKEVNIKDIHNSTPEEIESQQLSQIFKRADKNEDWKKLVVEGRVKGFYRINPEYLKNGVSEIDLTPKKV